MRIFLHEITDQETELDFNQDVKWVNDAVLRADEKAEDEPLAAVPKPRTIDTHFTLHKVDEVIVISGQIRTHLRLLCSRCASYYSFPVDRGYSALFCKDPVMAGVAHLQTRKDADGNRAVRPVGQNHGYARHAHDDGEGTLESGRDLDITYISNDFIDLADVLSEQLVFQIPFQPLCRENCKGICPQCGADLNIGRCACAKLATARPFSVLKDFKN